MSTSLTNHVRAYVLFKNLSLAGEYRLHRSVAVFAEYLAREPRESDLADETVSHWVRWMQQRYSPKSVYGYRGDLLTLWRDCAQRGICLPPCRVCRVRKPVPMPVSWTGDEYRTLDAYVATLSGRFPTGVKKSEYCRVLGRVVYDTGLRRADIFRLDRAHVLPDGRIKVRQRKTNWPCDPRMRPETLAGFLALPGDCPLACPFKSPSNFYKIWKQVTAAAGVRHGAMQQMRRTGATHLAINHRDAVQRYLGHRTADMARYYIDESIAAPQMHMPPPLTD